MAKHFVTTEQERFVENDLVETYDRQTTLKINIDDVQREFLGFGCCLNELEYKAICQLDKGQRDDVLDNLFDPTGDLRLNICRLPLGANDYSLDWYSYDEIAGDYDLNHFSIERDQQVLIPFAKEALRRNNRIKFFASPWSPPTWMKTIPVYNNGRLIWEEKNLVAYANYFVKYIESYRKAGITIAQIHVQNEVVADQKFPSCRWTGSALRDFIKGYLGPLFAQNELTTEIWLGTINAPENFNEASDDLAGEYEFYAGKVLRDPVANRYITGVGYQWAGKSAVQRTLESYPDKYILQTENECGDGKNSWKYAEYIFGLFRHYLINGANGYVYWNAVLAPNGTSTWGWNQNSMVTINPETKKTTYNPEYEVMRHFSHFIKQGAHRITVSGPDSGISLAYKNPDGEIIVVLANRSDENLDACVEIAGHQYHLNLMAHSFHTLQV